MKKGIVIDIDDASLTLLTPEGEFLRSKKQNVQYVIGEEIHFFPMESPTTLRFLPMKNFFKVKPVWVVSVMAALIIFLSSFIPIYQDNKAYAYMSIDVNPSIELGVNKKMQVVELTGYNKEGKKVISSINSWKKKDIYEITEAIFFEMKKEGYMENNKPVIISTVYTTKPHDQVEAKLKENLEEIKSSVNNQQLEVTVYTGTEKEREKAQVLGITTGKYHENKIQATINEKKQGKPIQKQKDNTNNTTKTKPSDAVLPPGQLRKQLENGSTTPNKITPENNNSTDNQIKREGDNQINHEGDNQINHEGENQIPPGQLKRWEENQYKQNYGQMKKQFNQKDNSQKNHNLNQNDKHNNR
jgi:hypothetical protein